LAFLLSNQTKEKSILSAYWRKTVRKKRSVHQYMSTFSSLFSSIGAKSGFSSLQSNQGKVDSECLLDLKHEKKAQRTSVREHFFEWF
jgi:hypothetical protein